MIYSVKKPSGFFQPKNAILTRLFFDRIFQFQETISEIHEMHTGDANVLSGG